MGFTIAVSGKGGSGKTTLAALIIRLLSEQFGKKVMAVDADPNSTLGAMLGAEPTRTVADLREDAVGATGGRPSFVGRNDRASAGRPYNVPAGADRGREIERLIHETISEQKGFDLLTMERPEGPKCYCYVNHLLRTFLDHLSRTLPCVVVDNEAGMEHLSRRTTNDVDLLLVVSGPTVAEITSARRIHELADTLPIKVKKQGLVINRASGQTGMSAPPFRLPEAVARHLDETGLEVVARVPQSQAVLGLSQEGRPITEMSLDDPAARAVAEMVRREVLHKEH